MWILLILIKFSTEGTLFECILCARQFASYLNHMLSIFLTRTFSLLYSEGMENPDGDKNFSGTP